MRRITIGAALLLMVLAGCTKKTSGNAVRSSSTTGSASEAVVTVTSAAIATSNAPIPTKYTCDGSQTSLPIAWTPQTPVTIGSWTLRIDDPDAPGGGFVHWVVEGIPASTLSVVEGGTPAGGTVKTAYRGPCPPKASSTHHYVITVTGLQAGKRVATGQLVGTYQRP